MRIGLAPLFVAAAALSLTGCGNVPKYKHTSGKIDEWKAYEGKNFEPSHGTLTAFDPKADTVTISRGKDSRVLNVTPQTRVMHEADDVQPSSIPLNTEVKYTLSQDGSHLLTLWYGHRVNTAHPQQHQDRSTFY